jgi:hypothetical protein
MVALLFLDIQLKFLITDLTPIRTGWMEGNQPADNIRILTDQSGGALFCELQCH